MSLGQLCCGDRCVAQNDANCGGCGMTCDPSSGYTCVYGLDLTATMMVCCGTPPPIPGFPAVCGLPF